MRLMKVEERNKVYERKRDSETINKKKDIEGLGI